MYLLVLVVVFDGVGGTLGKGYTRKSGLRIIPKRQAAVKLARDARTLGAVCSAQGGPLGFHRH